MTIKSLKILKYIFMGQYFLLGILALLMLFSNTALAIPLPSDTTAEQSWAVDTALTLGLSDNAIKLFTVTVNSLNIRDLQVVEEKMLTANTQLGLLINAVDIGLALKEGDVGGAAWNSVITTLTSSEAARNFVFRGVVVSSVSVGLVAAALKVTYDSFQEVEATKAGVDIEILLYIAQQDFALRAKGASINIDKKAIDHIIRKYVILNHKNGRDYLKTYVETVLNKEWPEVFRNATWWERNAYGTGDTIYEGEAEMKLLQGYVAAMLQDVNQVLIAGEKLKEMRTEARKLQEQLKADRAAVQEILMKLGAAKIMESKDIRFYDDMFGKYKNTFNELSSKNAPENWDKCYEQQGLWQEMSSGLWDIHKSLEGYSGPTEILRTRADAWEMKRQVTIKMEELANNCERITQEQKDKTEGKLSQGGLSWKLEQYQQEASLEQCKSKVDNFYSGSVWIEPVLTGVRNPGMDAAASEFLAELDSRVGETFIMPRLAMWSGIGYTYNYMGGKPGRFYEEQFYKLENEYKEKLQNLENEYAKKRRDMEDQLPGERTKKLQQLREEKIRNSCLQESKNIEELGAYQLSKKDVSGVIYKAYRKSEDNLTTEKSACYEYGARYEAEAQKTISKVRTLVEQGNNVLKNLESEANPSFLADICLQETAGCPGLNAYQGLKDLSKSEKITGAGNLLDIAYQIDQEIERHAKSEPKAPSHYDGGYAGAAQPLNYAKNNIDAVFPRAIAEIQDIEKNIRETPDGWAVARALGLSDGFPSRAESLIQTYKTAFPACENAYNACVKRMDEEIAGWEGDRLFLKSLFANLGRVSALIRSRSDEDGYVYNSQYGGKMYSKEELNGVIEEIRSIANSGAGKWLKKVNPKVAAVVDTEIKRFEKGMSLANQGKDDDLKKSREQIPEGLVAGIERRTAGVTPGTAGAKVVIDKLFKDVQEALKTPGLTEKQKNRLYGLRNPIVQMYRDHFATPIGAKEQQQDNLVLDKKAEEFNKSGKNPFYESDKRRIEEQSKEVPEHTTPYPAAGGDSSGTVKPAPDATQNIRDFYARFKDAYESRNDSQVMSLMGDEWEAGDGTTLSDLQVNLSRSFRVFDEVRYNIQNLQIAPSQEGHFIVSYDVTITSKIYRRNIKHEEKSSVNEEVIIEKSGKVKIFKTLSGKFWYVE